MEYPTKDNLDEEFEIFDSKQGIVKTTWRKELKDCESYTI